MIDEKNNVIDVCVDCADEQQKKIQQNLLSKLKQLWLESEKMWVKKKFEIVGDDIYKSEAMWILVSDIDFENKTIKGTLDNTPVHINYIKFGDKVIMEFSEVCDIIAR